MVGGHDERAEQWRDSPVLAALQAAVPLGLDTASRDDVLTQGGPTSYRALRQGPVHALAE